MTAMEVTFAPWAQRGLGAVADGTVDTNGAPRPHTTSVEAQLSVEQVHDAATVSFRLRGPGDVARLAAGQIVRTNPVDGDAESEPNLFPMVEFASAHLPWLLTPATTTGDRLMPWLALVVIEDEAAVISEATTDRLAVLTAPIDQLPDLREAFAWAHVQFDDDVADAAAALDGTPELARARLVCPRHLAPATKYVAAVVPAFLGGVLAGRGLEVDDATIADLAWDIDGPDTQVDLPIYHRWSFTTAPEPISFEALARRLRPVPAPPTVGSHDLDVGAPGGGLPRGVEPTVVRYRGMLVAPFSDDGPGVGAKLRGALRDFVNAPVAAPAVGDHYDHLVHDPVVTAPLYGGRPAGEVTVPPLGNEPKWLGDLNLAPPARAVAGLGTEAVQVDQEAMMAEAWAQAAGLGAINEYLVHANAAAAVGRVNVERLMAIDAGLDDATVLRLTATAHARLRSTAARTVGGSLADHADFARSAFTTALGRVSRVARRPVRLGAAFGPQVAQQISATLVSNERSYDALLIHAVPSGTVEMDTLLVDRLMVAAGAEPTTEPGPVVVSGHDITVFERPLAGGVTQFEASAGSVVATATRPDTAAWSQLLDGAKQTAGLAGAVASTASALLHTSGLTQPQRADLKALTDAATSLSARATEIAGWELPAKALPARSKTELTATATLATDLAAQLDDVLQWYCDGVTSTVPVLRPVGQLGQLAATVRDAIDPVATVLAAVRQRIEPAPVAGVDGLPPPALRAHPTFGRAGLEHLVGLGVDYLCPGLDEVGNNAVSLLETNQAAVESFLIGLNDELARELLWREYPAVLTDTWITRFWNPPALGGDDIEPIAGWARTRRLGGPAGDADAVVFIRGDLLVHYPTALVYLLPGIVTPRGSRSVISPDYERPVPPSFVAEIGRGARIYGFPIDVEDLQAEPSGLDGGYFVVIEEQAGDPRFGLDDVAPEQFTVDTADLASWDDLGWGHLVADQAALDGLAHVELTGRRVDGLTLGDDTWGDDAAAMARITLRRPFRLIAHARTLL
jgi:hypothetical protein